MLFYPAKMALPNFNEVDGEKWAVIACDQFTSDPSYWEKCAEFVEDHPSTLNLILPEVYLNGDVKKRIESINSKMKGYEKSVFVNTSHIYMLVERVQSDGRVRVGLVGKIDLEDYSFDPDAKTPIRSTEGTVAERIPPRVRIRKDATYELPHVMLLIDDPAMSVIEPLLKENYPEAYKFPLMQGGGSIRGMVVPEEKAAQIDAAIAACVKQCGEGNELYMAVGDGNHSLATAKTIYEQMKKKDPSVKNTSPARYALVELVNLHSPALTFEPIYRVVTGIKDRQAFFTEFASFACACALDEACADNGEQKITCLFGSMEQTITFSHGAHSLAVGTVQKFLDAHKGLEVDYIHDEDALRELSSREDAFGFLFEGMSKEELFPSVVKDGPLPRKTFSMGHARDKRYYIEARKIK